VIHIDIVKVYKKGIIVLPKSIRKKTNIEEGMLLEISVEDNKIILKPLNLFNLWDKVWGCNKGKGSAEEAEKELDIEEEEFWNRREPKR